VSSAQGSQGKTATARIRFGSWAEFAHFLQQEGGAQGLFVRASIPPPIGTELTLHFVLPDASDLVLPGRVVHCLSPEEASAANDEPGMGVQLTHMSAEQAERVTALMAQAGVADESIDASGNPARRSFPPPPGRASQPTLRDPRIDQIVTLLDRARFDAAERKAVEVLTETPELIGVRILLLVAQARRARFQFDFDQALDLYMSILMIDSRHEEALEQIKVLPEQAEHTKKLQARVLGSGK
jgi:Tfp pilus assembly protein PilZ